MKFFKILLFTAVGVVAPNSMVPDIVIVEVNGVKRSPTVHPVHPFRPNRDAELLYSATEGWGTDEQTIIDVLAHRTLAQRREIARRYEKLFNSDLMVELRNDLDLIYESAFCTAVMNLMTPLPEIYARALRDAVYFIGTDEEKIINVLVPLTNDEIHTVSLFYEELYQESLRASLIEDTSDDFKDFVLALVEGNRDENQNINEIAAKDAASHFQEATDEIKKKTLLMNILTTTGYPQLRRVFDEYKNITGKNIEEAIDEHFSGDAKDGLLAVVKFARNKNEYFADLLFDAMDGAGTNEEKLTRVIVTRSEKDLGDIGAAYRFKHSMSLKERISDDTSDYYEILLLALLGP